MAFGRFQTTTKPTTLSDMNITPMVDVMLVLLIIFMIAAPVVTQSLRINLPSSTGVTIRPELSIMHVAIDQNGMIYLNEKTITLSELNSKLTQIDIKNTQPELQLYADKNTRYEIITDIMSLAQSNGVSNITFVTSPTH